MDILKTKQNLEQFYDIINYRNALEILCSTHSHDFQELLEAFLSIRFSTSDILKLGGNESNIPKKYSSFLRAEGWFETRISGDLLVTLTKNKKDKEEHKIEKYLDGHKIDYVKNRVAFDLKWNSKDQTFDRDLYAFASFYQADIIDVAILMTRSEELNEIFTDLGVKQKYGASTTWIGKLEYRIKANRSNGCPVLVLAMKQSLFNDWKKNEIT